MQDPRTGSVTLTFAVAEGEQARVIGARLARDVLKEVGDAQVVTVRGTRRGQLVFIADVMRSKNEETLSPTFLAEHAKQAEAWVDHILSREWPPKPAQPAQQPDTQVPESEDKPAPEEDQPAVEPKADGSQPEETPAADQPSGDGGQPQETPPGEAPPTAGE